MNQEKKHSQIDVYGRAIRFSLRGSTIRDYEMGLDEVFDFMSQYSTGHDPAGTINRSEDEGYYLQTFTNVMYRDELEFFLRNGFFINNVMLFMELDAVQFTETFTELVNSAFRDGTYTLKGFDEPAGLELYDTQAGLEEYLEANALGFGEPDPVNQLREELSYDNAAIYLARHSGRIVSSVTVWDLGEDCIATENIFTIPGYRELGLAKNLLTHVISTKTVNGTKKIRLTVFGDNPEAISMYCGMGFKIVSEKYELRY